MRQLDLDELRDNLQPISTAADCLSKTEPLNEVDLVIGDTSFIINPGWNHGLDSVEGTAIIDAFLRLGSTEFRLTKDALLQAAAICGLSAVYVKKTPATLIESHLNYWYGLQKGLGAKELKLLITDDTVIAITKATLNPFSSLRLLEETLAGIRVKYGNVEVLVDPKFKHSVVRTNLRLIIPEMSRQVINSGNFADLWSVGVSLKNSLIGAEQTSIDGYLLRLQCLNGVIDTHASSGVWSRRSGGQSEDLVYEWAKSSVDGILDNLLESFDYLQSMTEISMTADINKFLKEMFTEYKISAKSRQEIISSLVEDPELTMYSLLNIVTSIANLDNTEVREQERLLLLGGALLHHSNERCSTCYKLIV